VISVLGLVAANEITSVLRMNVIFHHTHKAVCFSFYSWQNTV